MFLVNTVMVAVYCDEKYTLILINFTAANMQCSNLTYFALFQDHLPSVMALGTHSTWPIALVDIEKQTVQISAPYWDHRRVKLEAQKQDVKRVIGTNMKKPVQL